MFLLLDSMNISQIDKKIGSLLSYCQMDLSRFGLYLNLLGNPASLSELDLFLDASRELLLLD
jgi:hypothetical protein